MSLLCLSLTEKTLRENLQAVERYKDFADVLELRADFLNPSELEKIRRFPDMVSDFPVILTVRRKEDGGRFPGSEEERQKLILRSLKGPFRYVDIEEDLQNEELPERAKKKEITVIRSFHDFSGVPRDLKERINRLLDKGESIPKAAVTPKSTADLAALLEVTKEFSGKKVIILGMGPWGFPSRVLAPVTGMYLSYSSSVAREAAPGHIDPETLCRVYRFKEINKDTKLFGIIGNPVYHSYSPVFQNAGFRKLDLNCLYIPFQVDFPESFLRIGRLLGVQGFSVTIPFKEKIIPFLSEKGGEVDRIGSCNTVLLRENNWTGRNFDWLGFIKPLRGCFHPDTLKGKKCTIIGAGGAARAAAYALTEEGADILILNRTPEKAGRLAGEFGGVWGELSEEGCSMACDYSDVIIQTTSVGMAPLTDADPFTGYKFRGSEIVYDLIYIPEETRFLSRARSAGCRTLNGKKMLLEQGYCQFKEFTGCDYPPDD